MSEQLYQIYLQTPLGKKRGTMRVERKADVLSGELDILEHRKPFQGTIDETGQCNISGTIITLMRTVPYTAVGRIEDGTISLTVKGERNRFELLGTVCEEGGGNRK